MKILVTGGGGFIGSHMVERLSKDHDVTALDIEFPKIREKWWNKAEYCIQESVMKYHKLENVFCDLRPEMVFHFASDMGGVGYFTAHDYYPFLNNMEMDMNILSLCERYSSKLFYSSSACIYPINLQRDADNPAKLREDMIFPANSDQMYGWEKLMMTMLCQRSPVSARVGIFHTIFGEGQEFEGERAKFPPTIVKKVLESRHTGVVKIWGDGKQMRTYLYIDDAVEKIMRVAFSPSYESPVNIAGKECVSVLDTAKLVSTIVGVEPTIIFEPDKPSGVLGRDADHTKFEEQYGQLKHHSLKKGFEKMVKWVASEMKT